jgi:hypothetical protein
MLEKNNIWKVNAFIILALSIFILSSINVHALGVGPSKTIVSLQDANKEYSVSIINNEHKDLNLVIMPQGEYAKYVSILQPYLSMNANDQEKEFKYSLDVPSDMPPGESKIILLVTELPNKESAESGTNIQSLLSVEHQIIINVPYPGVFAEGIFFINEADVNETINFAVNVINKGTEDIYNVNGELVIKGPTNEELKRIKSNTISTIASKTSDKLFVDYVADMNPGVYYAEFIVNYGNKQFVLRKTFTVDKLSADVSSLIVEDFKLGYISKVDIDVLNRWNQPIDDAYAYLQVLDSQGNTISETKTSSATLTQLTTTTLSGYWDTKGINIGDYDMKVVLHYNDKVSEQIFKAVIGIDKVEIAQIGGTGLVAGKGTGADSKSAGNSLLYIIVSILVVVNIFLVIVYFKYIKKKNEPL